MRELRNEEYELVSGGGEETDNIISFGSIWNFTNFVGLLTNLGGPNNLGTSVSTPDTSEADDSEDNSDEGDDDPTWQEEAKAEFDKVAAVIAELAEKNPNELITFPSGTTVTLAQLSKALGYAGNAGDGLMLGVAFASGDQTLILEAVGDVVVGAIAAGVVTAVTGSPIAGAVAATAAGELFSLPGVINAVNDGVAWVAAGLTYFSLNQGNGIAYSFPDINIGPDHDPWNLDNWGGG